METKAEDFHLRALIIFLSSPISPLVLPGAENPTYLKEPSDKIVFAIGTGGIFLGLGMVLNGLRNMSLGINKTP